MPAPAVVIACLVALPPTQGGDLQLARSLTKGYESALRNRDIAWFRNNTAWNMTNTTSKGQYQIREKVIADLRLNFSQISKIEKLTLSVVSVRRVPAGLQVTAELYIAAHFKNKISLFESTQREQDLWTRTGGRWKLQSTKTTQIKTKVQGKTVP